MVISLSGGAAGTRFRPSHPRWHGCDVLEDIDGLGPFGEGIARRAQRMATSVRRRADAHGRFVQGISQFYRPLIEKINGVPYGSDFDNRELAVFYEEGSVEKLVVHLILPQFSAAAADAGRKYEFCGCGLQGAGHDLGSADAGRNRAPLSTPKPRRRPRVDQFPQLASAWYEAGLELFRIMLMSRFASFHRAGLWRYMPTARLSFIIRSRHARRFAAKNVAQNAATM